jgi:hypothetical protein
MALAVVVGAPFAVLAWTAWRGDRRAELAAGAAGVLLVGWIVVQLAILRAPSFLHAVYLAVGLAFAYAGRRALTDRGTRGRDAARRATWKPTGRRGSPPAPQAPG